MTSLGASRGGNNIHGRVPLRGLERKARNRPRPALVKIRRGNLMLRAKTARTVSVKVVTAAALLDVRRSRHGAISGFVSWPFGVLDLGAGRWINRIRITKPSDHLTLYEIIDGCIRVRVLLELSSWRREDGATACDNVSTLLCTSSIIQVDGERVEDPYKCFMPQTLICRMHLNA